MGDTPSRGTIAERLTWLIETRHPNGTGPSSYDEIARRSRELASINKDSADKGVSHQTVLNVANGTVKNPGINTVKALARVFQVRVSYLVGESDHPIEDAQGASGETQVSHEAATASPENAAKLLDFLFTVVVPKGREPFTEAEVALGLTQRGYPTTESQIHALRTGQGTSAPSRDLLEGIAAFFMVPSAIFFDPTVSKKVSEDLALLNAFRGVGAREIAMRTLVGLPEEACQALVPMIEHLSKAGRRQRM